MDEEIEELYSNIKEVKSLEDAIKKAIETTPPEELFGNEKIIKLLKELHDTIEVLKSTDECKACAGKGYVEHDCDCEHCTTLEVDCEKCFGSGRVDK